MQKLRMLYDFVKLFDMYDWDVRVGSWDSKPSMEFHRRDNTPRMEDYPFAFEVLSYWCFIVFGGVRTNPAPLSMTLLNALVSKSIPLPIPFDLIPLSIGERVSISEFSKRLQERIQYG